MTQTVVVHVRGRNSKETSWTMCWFLLPLKTNSYVYYIQVNTRCTWVCPCEFSNVLISVCISEKHHQLLAFVALSPNKQPTNPLPPEESPRLDFFFFLSWAPSLLWFRGASPSYAVSISTPTLFLSIIRLAALRTPAAGGESLQSCFSWTLQHIHL